MNARVAVIAGAAALTLFGTTVYGEVADRASTYDKVLVDGVEVSYDAASPLQSLNDNETQRVLAAVRAALGNAAGARFTFVDEPGPGVLRVHATIAGVDAAKKAKRAWRFTPVGLIKTRVDAASGADFVLRAAHVEVELFDAQSGQSLGTSVAATDGTDAAPSEAASLPELLAVLEAKARPLFADIGPQARAGAAAGEAVDVDEALAPR